ncbi:MAG TPA: hypothetical protein VF329_01885 [Gammaproteobacteria bacterium]
MSVYRSVSAAAGALVALGFAGPAAAQFGVSLPQKDFTWQWGNPVEARGSNDFSTQGSEAGFRCDLRGALRLGSRMTTMDVRALERELGVSLYFIQAATNAMNTLDYQRELDWAVLECTKPEPRELSAEEQQERLDKLRERALRRQAERRERREREEARAAD